LDSVGIGSQIPWPRILRCYAPQVETPGCRLAGPRFDAEDLLQRCLSGRAAPGTRIPAPRPASRLGVSYHSPGVRWRRRNDVLRRWLWGLHGQALAESRSAGPTPVEEIERREESLRLYAAMDRLPEKYRTVLILSALERIHWRRHRRAAWHRKPMQFWVRLHRARAKLADLLTEEEQPWSETKTRARSHPA